MVQRLGARRERREKLVGFLFVLPCLIKVIVFCFTMVIACCVLAFTDYNITARAGHFIGIANFVELFSDPIFYQSLFNTVFYMIGIPIGFLLAFMLAYALNSKSVPGKGIFRVIYYLPHVTSAIAIGLIWKWILNDEFGLLNMVLHTHIGWMSDPHIVKISLMIKGLWGGIGGNMLMLLAGMQSINDSLMEYAVLEGANPFQKMYHIVLPLLRPIFFFMTITSVLGGLNAFADNYIVISSRDTNTIIYFLYSKMKDTGDYGLISAGCVFVGLIGFIFALIQMRSRAKSEAK